jgi:hypothetical protein
MASELPQRVRILRQQFEENATDGEVNFAVAQTFVEMLVVSGPSQGVGTYRSSGYNHGKLAYAKDGAMEGVIYFWDDRDDCDGMVFQGWYMGHAIGGDEFWTYHPSTDINPPESGWYFGSAVDHNILIQMQAIDSSAITLCCYQYSDGTGCLNTKPSHEPFCIRDMCKSHCLALCSDCGRHTCDWQRRQDDTTRSQRANRRRGGIRSRGNRGPYEAA